MAQSAASGKVGEKPGIRKRLKEGKSGKYRQAVERPNDADREAQRESTTHQLRVIGVVWVTLADASIVVRLLHFYLSHPRCGKIEI